MRFALSFIALSLFAGTALAQSYNTSGADKLGWKLTLQSWTTHGTVEYSIGIAKQIGVHYIEIYPGQKIFNDEKEKGTFGPQMTDEEIKKILEIAKDNDVKIIDTGVIGISSNEAEARKLFDWAKTMGITTIISEPEPKALPMIDKLAGEYHIKVAIHDHPKPSRYWDPEYTYDLIKDLPHIGFCADVGHWKRSGLEPSVVLEKYGQKVFSSHFKDLVHGGGSNNLHDVPWGTGESKAALMLSILKDKGFRGPIAIEYEYTWDVPTLRKCAAFFYDQANLLAKTK
jgi:sugar phosphate isomerase/epimerase